MPHDYPADATARDEYRWNPALSEDVPPPEVTYPPEYLGTCCEEIAAPAPEAGVAPEFEGQTLTPAPPARDDARRRERIKKLFAVPIASAVAVASIVFAAMGEDPLKNDVLMGGSPAASVTPGGASSSKKTEVPLPTLDGEVTYRYHVVYQPTGETYYNSALTDAAALTDAKNWVTKQGGDPATMLRYQCDVTPTGRKPSEGALYVGDVDDLDNLYFLSGSLVNTYRVDVYYEAYAKGGSVSAFPTLTNLDPDFAGKYAWAGAGSEEYLVVAKSKTDYAYLHAGTYYTDKGVTAQNVSGASYDKATNTLTLTDYHGGFIDANLMGNGFTVKLVGDNSLDYMTVWGAMYGGSVTFTGSGSLTLNKSGNAPDVYGLMLECEDSASCLMVDSGVTLDVYGQHAIVIHRTTMEKAIYVQSPVEVTGGKYGTGEFVVYTVNVTDSNGNVVFDEDGNPITTTQTVKDIAKSKGIALYDASIVGSDGLPAAHVTFKPKS